jgi:lipopolysaccharide transport system permease protein
VQSPEARLPRRDRPHPRLARVLRQGHLLRDFLGRDLRARYVGSAGGFAWAVLHPLVLLGAYTVLFSVILQVRFGASGSVTAFALYLYCGMLPWQAFADAAARATSCLVQHRHLIKTVRFPAEILPTTVALTELVNQGIGLVMLTAAAWILGHPPGWGLLLLPLLVALQLAFTLGLSMGLATVNVFFRDIEQFTRVGFLVWMFLTPIFYPEERVPDHLRALLELNPMTHLVRMYRAVLLEGRLVAPVDLAIFAPVAVLVFAAGHALFTRWHHKFVDLL